MRKALYQITTAARATRQQIDLFTGLIAGRGVRVVRGARPRIGFQCYSRHHANFFQTLLRRLAKRDDIEFELLFLSHPHFSAGERAAVADYIASDLGLETSQMLSVAQRYWASFDLVLYPDTFARLLPRSGLNVLLYHGMGTPKRYTERAFYRRHAYDFDHVMAASDLDRETLEGRRPPGSKTTIHAPGSVIFDRLPAARADVRDYLEKLGLKSDQRLVLYAPHWTRLTCANEGHVHSIRQALEALVALGLQVILKLHAHSYNRAANLGRDWLATVRPWLSDRIQLDIDLDDVPALTLADVVVTDVSSRGIVAAMLGKPVIQYLDTALPALGRDDVSLEAACYDLLNTLSEHAATAGELQTRVREALSGTISARHRLQASTGIPNDGAATDRIIAIVEALLAK